MQIKIPKSPTLKATILFTDDRKPWVKSSKLYLSTHVFHNYFPNTYTCIIYVKICHKNNLGLRCELGLLRVDVPMSLPRRFFLNRNPKHRHSHHKKVPFFSKKQWNWDPFHVPRGTRPMLKRTPFYREILVGDDNIMAQVAPPGLYYVPGSALKTRQNNTVLSYRGSPSVKPEICLYI